MLADAVALDDDTVGVVFAALRIGIGRAYAQSVLLLLQLATLAVISSVLPSLLNHVVSKKDFFCAREYASVSSLARCFDAVC